MPPTIVYVPARVLRGDHLQGLTRLAKELALPGLTLDLGGVDSATADGLAQLLSLQKELRAAGSQLSLVNVRRPVRKVFDATGLKGQFDMKSPRRRPQERKSLARNGTAPWGQCKVPSASPTGRSEPALPFTGQTYS